MALPGIFVTVGAKIDGFEKSMGDVSKRLNAIDREASRAFSGFEKVGQRLSTIGTGLTAAITLPLAAAGAVATKFAVDFESEMRKVTSLLGGATATEFAELNKKVLEMSRSLGIDAVGAAKAVYEAISAGIPKENVIDFVTVASKAAIAGATDTKVAVDALTTIIAAYGLKTTDAKAVSDALFQAVNVGKFQFEDLAKAIGPAANQANNLGISYQELLAATASLSLTSGGVSIAVTQIESAMRALLQRTPEMDAALAQIGFKTANAAIAALGFEGTLQELRKTAKGSTETFNAYFGRIEGATGALGLTGKAAETVAKHYDVLKKSADGVGATQTALEERNKSTARQFEALTAGLKVTAIEMGTSLLPAVNKLIVSLKPLIDFLASAVKMFGELPPGVQAAALAIAALAAAAGPLILAAGSIIKALAVIGPAITSLTGMFGIAGGAGLSGALAIAGPLAIAFGVAIAAWAIVTAINEVSRLHTEMKRLTETMERGGAATKEEARVIKILESAIVSHNKQIGVQQVEVSSTGKSVAEYTEALKKAIKENNIGTSSFEKSGKALTATANAADRAATTEKELAEAVKKAEAAYKTALRAYDQGKISLENLTQAQVNLIRAQDAADPERIAKRHESAYFSMLDRFEETASGIIKAGEDLKKADEALAQSAVDLAVDYGKAHSEITKAAAKTVEIVVPLNKRLPEGLQRAMDEIKRVADAYEQLGLTAPKVMQATVEANKKAWETISKDAGSRSVVALEAWIKYEESRQDAARRSGQVIPEEQRKALDKAQEQLDRALGKQVGTWGQFTKQVSTIINDFAKDLARGTVDLIKNLFDFDGFNKKLREDSEKLRDELAERSEALEQFRTDTAKKIADAESGYAAQLAKETGEIQSALAERTAEYEQYVEEVAVKLETLRNVEAERLSNEVGDLAEKLRDKEYVYEEYLVSVGEKEKELRDSHAERLAEQLANLRDNLRDRTRSYDDFVVDANEKLARIGEDLAETVEDAMRSNSRRMEDENTDFWRDKERFDENIQKENTDFARDQEKLNEDILKASKKGDKEQVASLRKSLKQRTADHVAEVAAIKKTLEQRTADHEKAVKRMKEDIAEQVDDAKQRAREQTDDLNRNLALRTRDHQAFIAENLKDQETLTTKSKESLAKQLGDLQENVAKRTAELLKFREETDLAIVAAGEKSAVRLKKEEDDLQSSLDERRYKQEAYERDTADKIDALTLKYIEKQAEEVAGLNSAFDAKLKEYDKYRTGVEQKMLELEEAHKGPLDRIKDMFKTVFDSAAEAVLRLASEEVIGRVIKQLKEILDLGPKVAGVLIPSAPVPGVPSVPTPGGTPPTIPGGSPADVAGTALSTSISGLINVVTGVITAVASVISAIYDIRQEGTLNQIERNTAAGSIHLKNILEKANAFWPVALDTHRFLGDVITPVLREIRDGLKTLFAVNLNLTGEDEKNLVSSLITRVGTFDTLATDRLLDINASIGSLLTATQDVRSGIVGAIATNADRITASVARVENKLPGTIEKIFGGGGSVFGLAGLIPGLIAQVIKGGGSDEELIEENTRFTAVGIIGKSGVVDTLREFAPFLETINKFNYDVLQPWMAEMSDLLRDGTNSTLADIRTLLAAPLVNAEAEAGLFGDGKLTVNLTVDGRVLSNVQIGLAELAGAGV